MLKKIGMWILAGIVVLILYSMAGNSGYAMGAMIGGWIKEAFAVLQGLFDGAS